MGYLGGLRDRAIAYGRLLLAEHRRPGEVAVAIVLGCIVGCLPLTGLQLFICIGLARLLRLNLPIMYGAANISIPPIVPFIGWGSVQIGEWLRSGHFVTLHRADFAPAALPALVKRFFFSWMLGGAILGAAVGLLAGSIVYAILRRRQRPELSAASAKKENDVDAAVDAALARAARRYDPAPPKYRYYARAKYRMDPCYKALCSRIPAGAQVADLGCGLGMLAVALAELGDGRRTFGVDWDAEKIAAGQLASRDLPDGVVTLQRGDLRETPIPACDVVTIVDVLHYYEPQIQREILRRAKAALRPGGLLFIRETDPEQAGGARLTRFYERLMVRLGWNRGPKVHYLPVPELHRELEALGLVTHEVPVAGKTHPGNVLLCADGRRPEQAAPDAPMNDAR